MSEEAKKLCFVITPIGSKDTPIRRHIEGIIDHAIIPALESKYEVEVAHRKYEIGSINDRIINSIYTADLVVANLTSLNPNVMFELAIRYSFAKPAIVIAEQGTQLPFDIIDENTIFYDNDPTGAYVLKEQLINFENNIVFKNMQYGPVYKALGMAALYKDIESGQEVPSSKLLRYIIDKLDELENEGNYRNKKALRDRFMVAYVSFNGYDMNYESNDELKKLVPLFLLDNDIIKTISIGENYISFKFKVPIYSSQIDSIIRDFGSRISISEHDCLITYKKVE